ncbi:MAG: hypothetical protein CMG48_00590 [Candidatus Marinimicrobia bacterium]|nr:hypothetical protein [Candidatus Neomarinimicrobiota bacterium]
MILFRKILIFLTFCLINSNLSAQNVKLIPEPGFVPYSTYYLSSIDLSTGSSDVEFFNFRLSEESGDYLSEEIWASIQFEVSMISPALGISNPTTIISMESDEFQMFADIRISNTYLSTQTSSLFDMSVPPKQIPLSMKINKMIDFGKFQELLSAVITTGKLADGNYTFRVTIKSGLKGNLSITDDIMETVQVTSSTSLNLISPGGELADSLQNIIFSPYPIFQWDTNPCQGCESFIRVAKFDPNLHSSINEAINDITVLPVNQSENWKSAGFATNYQYPFTDAIDLEPGSIYVWQVQKKLPTTEGVEAFTSPIFAFKLVNFENTSSQFQPLHPVLQQLKDVLGEQQFQSYFGPDSELIEFEPNGTYQIDGIEVSVDEIIKLMNEFYDGSKDLINITVE